MKSLFEQELDKLEMGTSEVIVNGNKNLSEFQSYMHIERDIENKLRNEIELLKTDPKRKILLIVGNVGDGKSHLISKMAEELEGILIYNDATESIEPNKSSLESLKEFIFDRIDEDDFKAIVAINLGVLYNFYESGLNEYVNKYLDRINIFNDELLHFNDIESDNKITTISFLEEHYLEIDCEGNIYSKFIENLYDKIFGTNQRFYKLLDYEPDGTLLKQNYLLLNNEIVKKNLLNLLFKSIVINRTIISTRDLITFFYELISNDMHVYDLIFSDSITTNKLIKSLRDYDPVKNLSIDQEIEIVTQSVVNGEDNYKIYSKIRENFLKNEVIYDAKFNNFLKVKYYQQNNKYEINDFIDELKKAIVKLTNIDGDNNRIYFEFKDKSYKISQDFELRNADNSVFDHNVSSLKTPVIELKLVVARSIEKIEDELNNSEQIKGLIKVSIDYRLFEVIKKLNVGYVLNKFEKVAVVQLTELTDKILEILSDNQRNIYFETKDNGTFKINVFQNNIEVSDNV